MESRIERIRQTLIGRISSIIEKHRAFGPGADGEYTCSCGANGLSDRPRHVAEQIVEGLGLKPDGVDEIKQRIRYASAWFDWELTKLEGAEY